MIIDWTRNVFAYGSLMSTADVDIGRAERQQLAAAARLVGPASIGGLLFDVGPYPAAVLTSTGRDRIWGELWRLPARRQWLFDVLDRYEGCAPGSPEPYAYVRQRVAVRAGDGSSTTAWIYLWNRPLGSMSRIESGRWRPARRSRDRDRDADDETRLVGTARFATNGFALPSSYT